MATVSEITEKECVKELPRTRQRDFELCSIAQPSQHRLNACLWQRIGQDITFFDRYQIILFGQRGMFNNNNNNNVTYIAQIRQSCECAATCQRQTGMFSVDFWMWPEISPLTIGLCVNNLPRVAT